MTTEMRLSLDEFLALPESEPASEWVDGEVLQKPMPNQDHSDLQNAIAFALTRFVQARRLGKVRPECRCVFGPPEDMRVYVPDVVFVRREKLMVGPRVGQGPFRGAPDLAVEIVSPDQPAAAFVRKINFYQRHGVELVWVVDPDTRTVTVFTPDGGERTLREGETLDGGAVLPGFALAITELFQAMA